VKRSLFGLPILLCALAFSARTDPSELRKLSDAHRFFLLRDAVIPDPHAPDFYQGEVPCVFNQTTACEEKFKKVLAAKPKGAEAEQIHRMLAAVALRQGQYRRSLQELDALLALNPNDSDARGSRPLIEALSHFPDQQVQGANTATIQLEEGRLPVLINGQKASYFFDSGANLSVMSQSEAERFGMKIQEITSGARSTDISGNKVSFRIAVAGSLALGDLELTNVAFLVSSNDQQPFVDMKPGQRGLIGLPVLLAFGSVTWNANSQFTANRSPASVKPSANICLDDLDLITLASFDHQALPFVLDTGAATTALWPKFADVAHEVIRKSGTSEHHTVEGMGGKQDFEVTSLPKVVLELGGKSVVLQPAHILKVQQRDTAKWYYGNLGIDLLKQAQSVTINFRTMMLELD
jgi:predicted aspartyl protease